MNPRKWIASDILDDDNYGIIFADGDCEIILGTHNGLPKATIERLVDTHNDSLIPKTELALYYAMGAHGKQKRKYEGVPYWHHCRSVGEIISRYYHSNLSVIQAAILHDTLEDTHITVDDIRYVFGDYVAALVLEVTEVSKPDEGNRAERKEKDRLHYSRSSRDGASIKLADLIDNTSSIVKHDKKFAKIYLEEKRLLLEVLKHGEPNLYDLAVRSYESAVKELADAK